MPLRRTKRSNGRQRPRWKDGSHVTVENTHANESRCNTVFAWIFQIESFVVPKLLQRDYEHKVSTRDRLARAGADARIKESAANGELCLVIRPYAMAVPTVPTAAIPALVVLIGIAAMLRVRHQLREIGGRK